MLKLIFLFLLLPSAVFGQPEIDLEAVNFKTDEDSTKVTVRVTPGPEYEASGFYEFFMGSHWRDLWTTSIEANVLDLNTFAGGLIPTKKGGSFQTKSLRFAANDGKEYKFRSINKDPTQSLPPHLKNSVVSEVLKDQTSILNPVSFAIVPRLLDEVGVENIKPEMVVLPDDEKLGTFRKVFGGLLGTIEEFPTSKKKEKDGFKDYDDIVTGFDIYERIEKGYSERIDEVELLKARLMDILMGDRDRHSDQWKWAGYSRNGIRYWKPIPRDRDFAFCLYDGLFPSLAVRYEPSAVGYGDEYPSMKNLTFIGRQLDRRFLNSLDKPVWDSVLKYIQERLTDKVILESVMSMPKEMYRLRGDYLISTLKERRNNLKEAADEYYETLYEVADVYGTDEAEHFEVKRLNDEEVEVTVYRRDIETNLKIGDPVFNRKYKTNITEEIRIFMLNGDNKAVVEGTVDNSIFVRIIGGKDKDELIDNSRVNGYFLGFTPFPGAKTMTEFCDYENTILKKGPGTAVNTDKVETPISVFEKYEPKLEDRYNFGYLDIITEFNTDDGLILGLNPNFVQHGFRADPNLYYLDLRGSYAFNAKDFDVTFFGGLHNAVGKSRGSLKVKASGIEFLNYFGVGNETGYDKDRFKKDFYKIEQKYLQFSPSLLFKITRQVNLDLRIGYEYSSIMPNDSSVLGSGWNYGTGKNSYLGLETELTFDSRDNIVSPGKGLYLLMNAEYYPVVFNNRKDFTRIRGDIRTYLSGKAVTDITLALRVSAEKIFGTYPFFKSAVLGGGKNLRGFSRERFSGDASLFGQAEARLFIADINILLPGRLGLSFFGESGRVFVKGETSRKWHASYGGGIWLSILNNAMKMSFSLAKSKETLNFYLISGVAF